MNGILKSGLNRLVVDRPIDDSVNARVDQIMDVGDLFVGVEASIGYANVGGKTQILRSLVLD